MGSKLNETKIEMMPTMISEAERYEKESMSLGGSQGGGEGFLGGVFGREKGGGKGEESGGGFGEE